MDIEVWSPEFSSATLEAVEAELERCDWQAYPGVVQEEIRSELGPLDALDEGTEAPQFPPMPPPNVMSEAADIEHELLDQVILPGMTDDVQAKRREWLKLSRPSRSAIRRLHQMIGHKSIRVMEQIMRATGVPREQIFGIKVFLVRFMWRQAAARPNAPRERTRSLRIQLGSDRRLFGDQGLAW